METVITSNQTTPTPYFDWINSNLNLPGYRPDYPYSFGEQVIYEDHLIMSLMDNNLGIDPANSIYWKQLI